MPLIFHAAHAQSSASLNIYTGLLAVATPATWPPYNATPLSSTVFAGATLTTQNSGVSLALSSTLVTAAGATASLALGTGDRRGLVNQIYASGNYTPMTLAYGGVQLPVTIACLLLVRGHRMLTPHRPQLEQLRRRVRRHCGGHRRSVRAVPPVLRAAGLHGFAVRLATASPTHHRLRRGPQVPAQRHVLLHATAVCQHLHIVAAGLLGVDPASAAMCGRRHQHAGTAGELALLHQHHGIAGHHGQPARRLLGLARHCQHRRFGSPALQRCRSTHAQALAVVNSSMTTLGVFAHLNAISTSGGTYAVNSIAYAAVVTGLIPSPSMPA